MSKRKSPAKYLRTLAIREVNVSCGLDIDTDTTDQIGEGYRYAGRHEGLHMFVTADGRQELFNKRKDAPSGWHLRRGAYCYEFVRTVFPDQADTEG